MRMKGVCSCFLQILDNFTQILIKLSGRVEITYSLITSEINVSICMLPINLMIIICTMTSLDFSHVVM